MDIAERLTEHKDLEFKRFNARLIPNISEDTMIGVRTPCIRQLAKEMVSQGGYEDFLRELPHHYFEENQLHAFIISQIKDFDSAVSEVERFLPFVDNWATCDQLTVKAFAKNPEKIMSKIELWIKSDRVYTVRFAIGLLMRYFLDDRFEEKYLKMVSEVETEEYYINMMSAWYFATALAKQYDAALPYFSGNMLPQWVHNKAIQKAGESYRVTEEHKLALKALKR